jgi:hypothetical protein
VSGAGGLEQRSQSPSRLLPLSGIRLLLRSGRPEEQVAISRTPRPAARTDEAVSTASLLTPVPGGVGPMTIAVSARSNNHRPRNPGCEDDYPTRRLVGSPATFAGFHNQG